MSSREECIASQKMQSISRILALSRSVKVVEVLVDAKPLSMALPCQSAFFHQASTSAALQCSCKGAMHCSRFGSSMPARACDEVQVQFQSDKRAGKKVAIKSSKDEMQLQNRTHLACPKMMKTSRFNLQAWWGHHTSRLVGRITIRVSRLRTANNSMPA